MTAGISSKSSVNIKTIALPAQHGGWGFWLEPTLAGLLLAWSLPGLALGIAGLMVLLLHQPLRIYLKDIRKGKRYERTIVAERFVLIYGAILLLTMMVTILNAPNLAFLLPPFLALPLVAIQLHYELKNQGRELIPELAGAVLFGAIAPSIVLLAGWEWGAALALWAALVARSVPSIVYVRARLRLEHGKTMSALPALSAHGLALVLLIILVMLHQLPVASLVAMALLITRCAYGLSRFRQHSPAKIIGFQEIALGIAYIVLLVLGY